MIELRSDTQTKPSPAMREVIANAVVGDEQKGEDPTVNQLLGMVADLLGQEKALFLPSGTMCNLVAVKTHTQPGDAILLDRQGHILRSESGGAAVASGVVTDLLPGVHGQFTADDVRAAMPGDYISVYEAPPTLLCVEQTHNFGGGTIWDLQQLYAVCDTAHDLGMNVHMDGARLLNAVVARGIAAKDYTAKCESVWIDFTKGLGAPLGAVLAGSAEFIERARRWKHVFGGAMRQAGIVAAGCIYALENNIERLADDHANAQLLAEGLRSIDGIEIMNPIDTNMVFFDTAATGISINDFMQKMQEQDVLLGSVGNHIRAVTHMDVSRDEIEQVIAIARSICTPST